MSQSPLPSGSIQRKFWPLVELPAWVGGLLLLLTTPAMAHHAMGGGTPSTFLEGFLSGLAHPLIGLDHFAFVVAVGLLASSKRKGIFIPLAFLVSAMVGTGGHLWGFSLPGAELFVSGSILLFGFLLVSKDSPNTGMNMVLAAIAGVFHGYAYGEAIFGAKSTPLFAYLVGFTMIQLVIAIGAMFIGSAMVQKGKTEKVPTHLRSAGLVLCGMGVAFFASQLISTVLPNG